MTAQQNAQPDSCHESAVRSVEAQRERLDQLLRQPECPVVSKDATFSSPPSGETRQDRRHPFLTEVAAVRLETAAERQFRMVRGWSLNFTQTTIGFLLPEKLDDEQLLLLVDHPDFDFPHCVFSARPMRVDQVQDDQWEYGAILRPMFGEGRGIEQLDRSLFELA